LLPYKFSTKTFSTQIAQILRQGFDTVSERRTVKPLEPDVRAYFPDSEAVNAALRSLIHIAQQVPAKGKPYRKNTTAHHA